MSLINNWSSGKPHLFMNVNKSVEKCHEMNFEVNFKWQQEHVLITKYKRAEARDYVVIAKWKFRINGRKIGTF
jgi:hypothetical protein